MAVRNSEALEVFLRVAAESRVSWQIGELAGRGISADAAGVLWVLSDGKSETEGEALADALMEQGELVDALSESWRAFDSGNIPEEDFEARLRSLVTNLEDWVARSRGPAVATAGASSRSGSSSTPTRAGDVEEY